MLAVFQVGIGNVPSLSAMSQCPPSRGACLVSFQTEEGTNDHGPFTEREILLAAYDGRVKPETKVRHEASTKNKWIHAARQISILASYQQGAAARAIESTQAAKLRTWVTSDGKYTTKAKLVDMAADTLTLEKEDGSRINVRLERLCERDRELVLEWKKSRDR